MDDFTDSQPDQIRWSAYQIASEEVSNRGITDPDVVGFLAQYLVTFRHDWVSFDETHADDTAHEAVTFRFFD
ncbi:hypothetical protein [Curtobacterium sp. RRHDQ10]|uniref:hypothetical protein n=1 Tax=Curtobacterium phyllosphaerae TaxID=3413379 RepID=UPI003BF2CBF2